VSRADGSVQPTFLRTAQSQTKPRHPLLAHKMALQQYGSSSKVSHPEGTTEFEILKSSHRYVIQQVALQTV